MTVIQLNDTFLKNVKRELREQCNAGSAHLAEAIARGVGYATNAALKSDIKEHAEGRYVPFDETAFRERLVGLSGEAPPPTINFPPLPHSARYIENLLKDSVLEFVELHPKRALFRLAGIKTLVEIKLHQIGNGYTRFSRSHAIHTPTQAGPYWPSRDFDEDAPYAMHRAIKSLVSYYKDAVKNGHQPEEKWLVPSH